MGGCNMSKEFKVGDIIVYEGNVCQYDIEDGLRYYEYGLKQIITKIDGGHYLTRYLEEEGYYKDKENRFRINSIYARNCMSVDEYIKNEYNNGIPLIWGDVIC